MNIVLNNPYRITGLLVGATAREQNRQIQRLKQFIEAEQEPENDFSFPTLGYFQRTLHKVDEAASKLNLDSDRMTAALFWFYKGNPITDEPAFDAIKEADLDEVISIWTKLTANPEVSRRNASAYSNLGTLYLSGILQGTNTNEALLEQGISLKLKFLESDFSKDLIAVATDETYKTTKNELQLLFLNQLQFEIEEKRKMPFRELPNILKNLEFSAKEDFLKTFAEKQIRRIEKKIDETRKKQKENPSNAGEYGTNLFSSIRELTLIIKILGKSDAKVIAIADKLANEILQCSITLFNHFHESDTEVGEISLDLINKAKKIAIGNVVRDRIHESTPIVEKYVSDRSNREIHRTIEKDIEFVVEKIKLASETLKNGGEYPEGYNDPYSDLPLENQPHNKNLLKEKRIKEIELKINQLKKEDEKTKDLAKLRFNMELSSLEFELSLEKGDLDQLHYSILALREMSMFENKSNVNFFRLARDIVKDAHPKLLFIKSSLGAENKIYRNLSNQLASLALACLIEYVNNNNSAQSSLGVHDHHQNAMNAIGLLDMDSQTRNRYNEQKQTLNKLYNATQRKNKSSVNSNSSSSGSCYIATMAYGDYDHPQVMVLRNFRDDVLDAFTLGKWFIKTYYKFSPKLVQLLKKKKIINYMIRSFLNQIINLIKIGGRIKNKLF
jgi:hypothetical protein